MKLALWLTVVVCALCAHARAAPRVAAADRSPHGEGSLVTRRDGKLVDVSLEHTEVAIRVDGPLVEATVTQRFRNPYATKIEAVYLFPLPVGAAVNQLTISSGGRTIRGTIQERAKAKPTYVVAREQGLVTALLAQERPGLFTQWIASLEPSAAVEVTLTYVQPLSYADGGYELVFPMMTGPRPAAVGAAPAGAGPRSSRDLGLRVELDAGVPIEAIESPSHRIAIDRPAGAPARATVTLHASDPIPSRDFVLRYRVAGAAPRFGVLTHRAGGIGSFLLLAQPPAAPADSQLAPREIVFLLDTSSSMRGRPLAKAKDVIRRVLRGLRADDTFQIVRLADRASPLGPAPIASKPRNVDLALDWLAALDASGPEVTPGIDVALAVPHDPARLRLVVLVTDGNVGDEDAILRRVAAGIGPDARLFAFGVGSAVNRSLLEELAARGRGAAQLVRPDEDSAAAVDAFERRIAAPVLTDLRIDWGGLAVTDVAPAAIPDLFAGQPLVLAGHYTAPGAGAITVRGRQAGREVSFQVPVRLPVLDAARPAVAAAWARQRIAELSRRLVRAADPALQKELIALALEHRLLTPYTALIAVDARAPAVGGAPVRVAVPVEVPAAMRAIEPYHGGGLPSFRITERDWSPGALERSDVFHPERPLRPFTSDPGEPAEVVRQINAERAARPTAIARRQLRGTLTILPPAVVSGEVGDGDPTEDREAIRRAVRRVQSKLDGCYQEALLTAPGLGGTVSASFVVGESGGVSGATASGVGNAAVEACIAQILGSIQFPRLSCGPARAVYSFLLKPPPPEHP